MMSEFHKPVNWPARGLLRAPGSALSFQQFFGADYRGKFSVQRR
jgi:hypothetical protein